MTLALNAKKKSDSSKKSVLDFPLARPGGVRVALRIRPPPEALRPEGGRGVPDH